MENRIFNEVNDELVSIVKRGEVIAFPTETVYGLGVIPSLENKNKLIQIKHRPENKPFTLMCSNAEQIKKLGIVDEIAQKIISHFMPGEITILIKAKPSTPGFLHNDTGVLGFRIPNKKEILDLINRVDSPLLVPSANRSGEPPLTSFESVFNEFKGDVYAFLKGNCDSTLPSTIIDLTEKDVKIIREGKIKKEEIYEFVRS